MDDLHIELYRVNVVSNTFERFDEIITAKNIHWVTKKNGIGSAAFNLNLWDKKANFDNLKRWRTQVAIVENKQILFFGPISKISFNYQGVGGSWGIECLSYLAHLTKRYVTALTTYTATDAGAIAWGLINTVQSRTNGNLVIYEGDIETTVNRDRTYEVGSEVAQKIIDLTNIDGGFDFELRYSMDAYDKLDKIYFDVYANRGTDRDNLPPLTIEDNLISIEGVTQDDITNSIYGYGSGTGDARLEYAATDSASQQDYTRLESILTAQDVSVLDTLEAKVNDELRRNKVERYHFNLPLRPNTVPRLGEYVLGDSLRYDLEFKNGDGTEKMRFTGYGEVIELDVAVDDLGVKFITPKLEFYI